MSDWVSLAFSSSAATPTTTTKNKNREEEEESEVPRLRSRLNSYVIDEINRLLLFCHSKDKCASLFVYNYDNDEDATLACIGHGDSDSSSSSSYYIHQATHDTSEARSITDQMTVLSPIMSSLYYIDPNVPPQPLDASINHFQSEFGVGMMSVMFTGERVFVSYLVSDTQPLVVLAHYELDPQCYILKQQQGGGEAVADNTPWIVIDCRKYNEDIGNIYATCNDQPLKVLPVTFKSYCFIHGDRIVELQENINERNIRKLDELEAAAAASKAAATASAATATTATSKTKSKK